MSQLVLSPYTVYYDLDGQPLDGTLYLGQVGQNPITYPIQAYWDALLTVPAPTPIVIRRGAPMRNGQPSPLYVASSGPYSMTLSDRSGQFVYTNLNGTIQGAVSDLNFDPTVYGLAVGASIILTTIDSPSNIPFSLTGPFTIVLTNNDGTTYNVTVYNAGASLVRSNVSGVWGSWSGSVAIPINSVSNPFVYTLPQAKASELRIRIVNTSALATGLIKVLPFTGDKIGPLAANTACYLQNVDQSGWTFQEQFIDLVDSKTGQWAVAGGQFIPEPGSVDAAGSQYHLGKLIHLPLGNTAIRLISQASAPAGATYSSAIQVTGNTGGAAGTGLGIPSGAKAVKARVVVTLPDTAQRQVYFTDNTSSAPFYSQAHPCVRAGGVANLMFSQEIDILLNSSGQFFEYTDGGGNPISTLQIYAIGYYMGV